MLQHTVIRPISWYVEVRTDFFSNEKALGYNSSKVKGTVSQDF